MPEYTNLANKTFSVRDTFGIDTDMKVKAFAEADPHVPPVDPDYLFDRNTTLAILAG
ncbi:MAG: cobaltochelatase subunit CobS, partial [Devosia sp.]